MTVYVALAVLGAAFIVLGAVLVASVGAGLFTAGVELIVAGYVGAYMKNGGGHAST